MEDKAMTNDELNEAVAAKRPRCWIDINEPELCVGDKHCWFRTACNYYIEWQAALATKKKGS